MTQAILLAAGRGSRMLDLTHEKPKCMIELAGKTLLDWQIEALQRAEIQEIFLVTGYLSNLLTKTKYRCFHNRGWRKSNMVESLHCARSVLSQKETIVSYGDIVYNSRIITQLLQSSSDIAIPYDLLWRNLWQERFSDPLSEAETFRIKNGKIREIGKKPSNMEEIEGQYMGLFKLTTKGWKTFSEQLAFLGAQKRKKMDMTTLLQSLIDAEVPLEGVPISGKWCEVDHPADLEFYEQRISNKEPWTHDWRG